MSDSDSEHSEEQIEDLRNQAVVTKYRLASDIANKTLQGILTKVAPGASTLSICSFGDKVIQIQCKGVFKGKKVEKGVAFPTCISVNEVVCHHSPLDESEGVTLKAGDVVKIDLGVHIDGYIAVVAHTVVVNDNQPITGPLADVLQCALTCSNVAHKLIKPGTKNQEVTAALKKVAESYGVNLLQGVLTHNIKRFVIDGNKTVIQREEVDQKVEDITFEENEAYAVDICVSSDEGKPRASEQRTTVFKKAIDTSYRLKRKTSRYLLNEVNAHHPTLPFSLRMIEDKIQAKSGIIECVKNELVHPYPVLTENKGAHVAHIKFTLLLLPNNQARVTGNDIPEQDVKSDKTVTEDIAEILSRSTKKKKKRKKKKKKKKTATANES